MMVYHFPFLPLFVISIFFFSEDNAGKAWVKLYTVSISTIYFENA